MKNTKNKRSGFALLMVTVVLVLAVVMGLGYMSAASVKLASSNNLLRSTRARYLAESGLQHALYVLQTAPESLAGSWDSHLGPYYVDGTGDSYYIYATSDGGFPEKYVLYSEGRSGGGKHVKHMTILCVGTSDLTYSSGMMISGGGDVMLPIGLEVDGDIQCQGSLDNRAEVHGNVTSGSSISDPFGLIDGDKNEYATVPAPPEINWADYKNYRLFGNLYSAHEVTTNDFTSEHSLADGGAVTSDNPGGVVWLKPEEGCSNVNLGSGLEFEGTIIVDGNLTLNGSGIEVEPVEGFPAIIVTGKISVKTTTQNAELQGLVVADMGIRPVAGAAGSSTEIDGGLVCDALGYDGSLGGTHELKYDEERAVIYDVSQSSSMSLEIISWDD